MNADEIKVKIVSLLSEVEALTKRVEEEFKFFLEISEICEKDVELFKEHMAPLLDRIEAIEKENGKEYKTQEIPEPSSPAEKKVIELENHRVRLNRCLDRGVAIIKFCEEEPEMGRHLRVLKGHLSFEGITS
jgi:hypothetical protein